MRRLKSSSTPKQYGCQTSNPAPAGCSSTGSQGFRTSGTSRRSIGARLTALTSSPEEALAKTSAKPAGEPGSQTEHDRTSGSQCEEPSPLFDLDSSCGRTSEEPSQPAPIATWDGQKDCWMSDPRSVSPLKRKTTLLEHWGVYSGTLPTSGMMLGGSLYPLQSSEHLTDESESSSSPGMPVLPTPRAFDSTGGVKSRTADRGYGAQLNDLPHLLPTPAVNDMGAAYTPETWDEWTEKMRAQFNNGNGHGKSLNVEVQRFLPTPRASDHSGPIVHGEGGNDLRTEITLLPTPSVADTEGGRKHRSGDRADELLLNGVAHEERFGEYAPAIARWEQATGNPAPAPTRLSPRNGKRQLDAPFAEWMMGLPLGWVTDPDLGLTRTQQLRLIGNGVVPQQALYALILMAH